MEYTLPFSEAKAHLSELAVVSEYERLPCLDDNEMVMPLGYHFGGADCQLSAHPQMQPEPHIA